MLIYDVNLIIADYIQSIYGAVLRDLPEPGWWPPSPLLHLFVWWCDSVDPLLGHNPIWSVIYYISAQVDKIVRLGIFLQIKYCMHFYCKHVRIKLATFLTCYHVIMSGHCTHNYIIYLFIMYEANVGLFGELYIACN